MTHSQIMESHVVKSRFSNIYSGKALLIHIHIVVCYLIYGYRLHLFQLSWRSCFRHIGLQVGFFSRQSGTERGHIEVRQALLTGLSDVDGRRYEPVIMCYSRRTTDISSVRTILCVVQATPHHTAHHPIYGVSIGVVSIPCIPSSTVLKCFLIRISHRLIEVNTLADSIILCHYGQRMTTVSQAECLVKGIAYALSGCDVRQSALIRHRSVYQELGFQALCCFTSEINKRCRNAQIVARHMRGK